MTEEDREKGVRLVTKYASAWAQRRNQCFNRSEFAGHIGKFIVRRIEDSSEADTPEEQLYMEYWSATASVWCDLACFALSVGTTIITEADVERSFSKQSYIFNKLRSRMKSDTNEAQMFLSINSDKIKKNKRKREVREDFVIRKRQRFEELLNKYPRMCPNKNSKLGRDDNTSDAEYICCVCNVRYTDALQCKLCQDWAHKKCGIAGNKYFFCANCS